MMNLAKLKGRSGLGIKSCLLLLLALALWTASAIASEVIPPPPKAYFNDYAGVTKSETARRLNSELEQFEGATSNQIVVAVYPKMLSDSSIEDYTVRVAHAWKVGQKERKNGVVLFVFVNDRKMFIQVGYGLEGALTDFLCSQIINNEMKPQFRAGDYDAGLTAAVHAIIAATKGEYKGTGKIVGQPHHKQSTNLPGWAVFLLFFLFWLIFRFMSSRFGRSGYYGGGGPIIMGGGGWGGGGGGSSGDSGGGFSGGGGDFGGGGAGGSW